MTTGEFLKQLDLNDKQIDIYLDLAAYPDSTVVEISRRIKLPRSSIYLELDRLIQKGLALSLKVGKTMKFSIADPNNLKVKILDESDKLRYLINNVENFAEEVEKLRGVRTSTNSINVYKGQAGIKQQIWNVLKCKSGMLYGFSPGTLEDVTDRQFAEKWRGEFATRGLRNKIILNKAVPLNWSDIEGFLDKAVEAKTLEGKEINFDREIFMYDDTLSIVSLKTDPDQYGIEITDRLLVQSYKQLFELIWNELAYCKWGLHFI